MAEEKTVKESLELMEGFKVLAVAVKKVAADGKVNFADFPVLASAMSEYQALTEAFVGADQIPAEVKDVTPEELQQIGAKFMEILAAIKAA